MARLSCSPFHEICRRSFSSLNLLQGTWCMTLLLQQISPSWSGWDRGTMHMPETSKRNKGLLSIKVPSWGRLSECMMAFVWPEKGYIQKRLGFAQQVLIHFVRNWCRTGAAVLCTWSRSLSRTQLAVCMCHTVLQCSCGWFSHWMVWNMSYECSAILLAVFVTSPYICIPRCVT
jgi:hypothetical protein